MLDRRERLSLDQQRSAGEHVARSFLGLSELDHTFHIGLYWAHRGEMGTHILFGALRKRGRNVYFPRVRQEEELIEFVPTEQEEQLTRGSFGIKEPEPTLAGVPVNQIEIMAIPGLAFSRSGARIGWGKGYYDKVLKGFKGIRVGLAYEFQIFDELPQDGNDQGVDLIITETEIIACR